MNWKNIAKDLVYKWIILKLQFDFKKITEKLHKIRKKKNTWYLSKEK